MIEEDAARVAPIKATIPPDDEVADQACGRKEHRDDKTKQEERSAQVALGDQDEDKKEAHRDERAQIRPLDPSHRPPPSGAQIRPAPRRDEPRDKKRRRILTISIG